MNTRTLCRIRSGRPRCSIAATVRVKHASGHRQHALRILRPDQVGRPRLAAGGGRPDHHLDGLHHPEPGLPVGQQPGQPAVRLRDRRRDLAGDRQRAHSGRDRPVRRLDERLRVGPRRHAVGEPGLAAAAGHRRRAGDRLRRLALLYALLFNRLGMPSFVATLAGLLAILGLQLYVLGTSGSINLPYGSAMVDFGQTDGDTGTRIPCAGPRCPAW